MLASPIDTALLEKNPWVRMKRYCEMYGDTPDAVHERRRRGKWIDGVHCQKVDGNVWVNILEVRKWIELKMRS
jgi:hypothetical protein